MSCVVGFISKKNNISKRHVIDDMANVLCFLGDERKKYIENRDVGIAIVDIFNNPIDCHYTREGDILILVGEIFGYDKDKKDLISKGHVFEKENDAEFCSKLYSEYSEKAFDKLNGSFSIVIYSQRNNYIKLVTDRFSSQPLFYSINEKGFFFSTQVSALLASKQIGSEINNTSLYEFFIFQRIFDSKTIYSNIEEIEPSSRLIYYFNDKLKIDKYWNINFKQGKESRHYYAEKLAYLIKISIDNRTKERRRYGLFLTGGSDSRMISAASDCKFNSYTWGYREDEIDVVLAQKISRKKKYRHAILTRNVDQYLDIIDKANIIGGGSYNFVHAHALIWINKIMHENDIVLHGYAPEVFFRGTFLPVKKNKILGFSYNKALKFNKKDIIEIIASNIKYGQYNNNSLYNIFRKGNEIKNVLNDSLRKLYKPVIEKTDDIYQLFSWADISHYSRLPSYLFVLSMRNFIKERSFILDNNLFDLFLEIPQKYRFDDNLWMSAMRILNKKIAGISLEKEVSITWQKKNKKTDKMQRNICNVFLLSHKWQKYFNEALERLPEDVFDKTYIKNLFIDRVRKKDQSSFMIFWLIISFSNQLGNKK